jgi:transposase
VKEQLVYCGVDIAKSYLDGAIGKEKRRLPNDAMGHREFIKWIKQIKGQARVICEPSGGYERLFIQALVGAQVKVSLVQANRVRAFARAAGILAKTDTIDAQVLCAFARLKKSNATQACHGLKVEAVRQYLGTL